MEEKLWIAAAMAMAFGSLILWLFSGHRRAPRDAEPMSWPPGPPKLPVVGNLLQLHKGGPMVHVTLANMARDYGKMMTVWFGLQPTIVISGYRLGWEVLVTKAADFASRTLPYKSRFTSADWRTLATSDFDSHWQALRKGVQGQVLCPSSVAVQTELQEKDVAAMVACIEKEAAMHGGVVQPLRHLRRCTIRLISRLCFGPGFDDDKFVEAMDCLTEELILQSGHTKAVDVFPFLRHIPILKSSVEETYQLKLKIEAFLRPYLVRYQSSPPNSKNSTSYLQFLTSQDLPEVVIIFNIFELFLLSVDSTSLATAWAVAFLIHHPESQERLYEDIIASCGGQREGAVTAEAVGRMKYLHAVVTETLRMRPIAPLAVPHRAVKDSTIQGHKVDLGTSVIVNIYALLHDPEVWTEPDRFDPGRFLREEEDGVRKEAMERSFVPFGAGRRVCAGMELAKLHVGLMLAGLVKQFRWSGLVQGRLPDLSQDMTFILRMKTPLEARIVPR